MRKPAIHLLDAVPVTLRITVTDAQTGSQRDAVSATVMPETGDAVTDVNNTSEGLEVKDLAAGIYTITASPHPGYANATYGGCRACCR